LHTFLSEILKKRKAEGLLRELKTTDNMVDFCSNDYLGFARNETIAGWIAHEMAQLPSNSNGATGSRLLAGNTRYAEQLEQGIADFHGADAGLIFNSGYDANLGLLSALPQAHDFVLSDALIHASMIDGLRLSKATRVIFEHNDLADLAQKLADVMLRQSEGSQIYVVVESVYSMDGDMAPLREMAMLCKQFDAHLIVDEAHATGVFGTDGRGVVSMLGLDEMVLARVVTFGKALGSHGAIVLGSNDLRSFLINFARSFIYSTAAPVHTLVGVSCAYRYMQSDFFSNQRLHELIGFFRKKISENPHLQALDSHSAIQGIVLPGNSNCRNMAQKLQEAQLDIRPIVWPTVALGQERLRICLHSYNTETEIERVFEILG
jgi:8-amino-7-oxononanoate synthase